MKDAFARPEVGRADLLLIAAACGEQGLERAAAHAGYLRPRRQAEPDPALGTDAIPPPLKRADRPTSAASIPGIRLWRAETFEAEEPDPIEDVTDRLKRTPPYRLPAEEPSPRRMAPPPLLPWSRTWPFVRSALGGRGETGPLDLPRIVRQLARLRLLRRFPRRPVRGWAPTAQIVLDYSPRLVPFWPDWNRLADRLLRQRGHAGLELLVLEDGVSGPIRRFGGGVESYLPDGYVPPESGTAILVVSDLGCLDGGSSAVAEWVQVGDLLRAKGHQPAALGPVSDPDWQDPLPRLFRVATWDRGHALPLLEPGRPSPRPTLARRVRPARARERLLMLMSPALFLNDALIRSLRFLLPVDEVDAAAEAYVWRPGPMLHGNCDRVWFKDGAADGYRERLRSEPYSLRRRVAELIWNHHQCLPEENRKEAKAMLQTIVPEDPALSVDPEWFWQMASLFSDPDAMARFEDPQGLQDWFRRLEARQDEASWRAHPGLGVAYAWFYRDQLASGEKTDLPAGLDPRIVERALAMPQGQRRELVIQAWRNSRIGVHPYLSAENEVASRAESPIATLVTTSPILGVTHRRADSQQTKWMDLRTGPHDVEQVEIEAPLFDCGWIEIRSDRERVTCRPVGRPAWAGRFGRDRYGLYADLVVRGVVQRMRWIPPGRFMMGSPEDEAGRWEDESPSHEVTIRGGFWLADTPCTQALWQTIRENPSKHQGAALPVEYVTWDDCRSFCERLAEEAPGLDPRLPTEAEWEYACRAGTGTAFNDGSDCTEPEGKDVALERLGWYSANSGDQTHVVKEKETNRWGLYDMHGNVWEWCRDWFGDYDSGVSVDPVGPPSGVTRVMRGGCFGNDARDCRSAYRGRLNPESRGRNLGFRFAAGQPLGPQGGAEKAPEGR